MENNKYEGTMYSHCDSTLTDRMRATDLLIRNLEYIYANIDKSQLGSCESLLHDVEKEIVTKCCTPTLHLIYTVTDNVDSLFKSIIYHVKAVFKEIYTSWITGVQGYTPVYAECIDDVSQKINSDHAFQYVLKHREKCWRGRK